MKSEPSLHARRQFTPQISRPDQATKEAIAIRSELLLKMVLNLNATTAELVQMTLQDLKDWRALWHGSVPAERRKEILPSIFNEP